MDCYAGVATLALGHCNSEVDEAVCAQIRHFGHISALYTSDLLDNYASKLISACGEPMNKVFFVNSGSEAVDLGISLARVASDSLNVVTFSEGYHGGTYLSKSATGLETWHFNSEQAPHICHVPSPLCADSENASIEAIAKTFSQISQNSQRPIMLLEPVMGVGGIVLPSCNYLNKLKELLAKHNGLLLLDEVQTGFGRCGDTLFAFQKLGLKPDVLLLGKAIANGYPLGAVLMTEEIAQANNELLHFNTFGGHPASIAAASVTLDKINQPAFLELISQRGERFRRLLKEKLPAPEVRDVRGVGYMTGLEVDSAENAARVLNDCFENKLLVGMGGRGKNVIRLQPALIFNDDDFDEVVNILGRVLNS